MEHPVPERPLIICGPDLGDCIVQWRAIDCILRSKNYTEPVLALPMPMVSLFRANVWDARVIGINRELLLPWRPGTPATLPPDLAQREWGVDSGIALAPAPSILSSLVDWPTSAYRHWFWFQPEGEPSEHWMFQEGMPFPVTGHQSDRYLSLAQEWCDRSSVELPEPRQPKLTLPSAVDIEIYTKVRDQLLDLGIDRQKLVLLHTTGSYETKSWDSGRWIRLIEALIDLGFQVGIIGARTDVFLKPEEENDRTRRVLSKVFDFRGEFSLMETAYLLQMARLLIGVDSGPAHIAAALGTAVVMLFSSVNNVCRWGVLGDPGKTRILCQPPTNREHYPIGTRQFDHPVSRNPYMNIPVRTVLEAVKDVLHLH